MQEPDNDRIEQFFRKATSRPDVTFNEEDWKKLEARLDAAGLGQTSPKSGGRSTAAAVAGVVLLLSLGTWWFAETRVSSSAEAPEPAVVSAVAPAPSPRVADGDAGTSENPGSDREMNSGAGILPQGDFPRQTERDRGNQKQRSGQPTNLERLSSNISEGAGEREQVAGSGEVSPIGTPVEELPEEKIHRELVQITGAEKYKQKAVVQLPGAEEEEKREAEAMVEEEHASDKKHVARPRLSLLLSFAPDFSGTSMGQYSAPGKAYGAMIHYHPFDRWSISAGVIKNHKQYRGDGEDYQPPKGYWKYYTNGVIPETIDGSCSILEFPVMLQYVISQQGKSRWLAGAGASSYLMQTESYRYHFGQPNPGAKEGWDSKRSSNFLFNMLNFSIAYERQIVPGLMLGIEPYAKIPLEEIGWSNLRLFSSGASLTLRYTIVGKRTLPVQANSRPPD